MRSTIPHTPARRCSSSWFPPRVKVLYCTGMAHPLAEFTKENDALVRSSRTFRRIVDTYSLSEKRVLDVGSSVGSHLLHFGPGSVGITTDPLEVSLGAECGRDIRLGNAEALAATLPTSERFDAIWCNNIFEHLLSPHAFLVHLKQFAHADTLIILGTPMVPIIPPLLRVRAFRGSLAVAHVNFFNYHTYQLTLEYAGWQSLRISPFFFGSHVLNTLATPFVPHLFQVAKNNANYRYHEKKLKEWQYDPTYQPLIKIMNPEWQPPSLTPQ